jgi:glycyl-tRNA synthetase beta chain
MSTTTSLLLELQVEELPPKALKKLGEAFAAAVEASLRNDGLLDDSSRTTPYATPRRLAAHVTAVRAVAPAREVKTKLMPVSVGLAADGSKTEALKKRLAKDGRSALIDKPVGDFDGPDVLLRESDGKVEALFLRSLAAGTPVELGVQRALDAAIDKLPIPKVMSYQLADGWTNVHFVRPVHSVVALYGARVLDDVQAFGLKADNVTHGHRFEAASPTLTIRDADSYASQLADQGAVIASFAERRAEILRQLTAAAAKEGLTPIEDDALLDEVTALVERPNVLTCQFEREFLDVPQECLILTMKANQKYFPLLDAGGRLTNKFLIVSNIHPADPSAVIQGNERVVRPRLADAKFFFDQDRKSPLASRLDGLANVVYHAKLGSQLERVERVTRIAVDIAKELGVDTALVERAARLAKADLRTLMVGEFPELQGIMGTYYARHDGEPAEVAAAIEEHYRPRFAGDALPASSVGTCVALADKLETLVGLFGVGERPTGDKDPFALRRHALGVLRMLIEQKLALPLGRLLAIGSAAFASVKAFSEPHADLEAFAFDRLRGLLRDDGYSANEVEAVVSMKPQRIDDITPRLAAVRAFAALPEAQSLAAANKRIGNILKKADGSPGAVNPQHLFEPAEKDLAAAFDRIKPVTDAQFAAGDYTAMLTSLAPLKLPVDRFFDDVMVNVDDPAIRANRLALLAALRAQMNRVADLSLLAAG